MTHVAWLLPTIPAVAAVVGLFLGRRLPGGPAVPAVLGGVGALVVAVGLTISVERNPSLYFATHRWTPIGGFNLQVGTFVDQLSAVVAVMVCVVALLVQIYSIGYMEGDPRYSTYAAEVSLFTAAMLLVVVSSDLFELLVGWEVMGLCSYLLVGHYWQTEGARAAAVKAFVVTRLGDVGFVIGIIVLGFGTGSFGVVNVVGAAARRLPIPAGVDAFRFGNPTALSHAAVTAGALLLLMGVVGKSAQFPLHVWLPDAMAGPTPISALIHAATMVAAGIFVVARLYPVFVAAPVSLTVLGVIACITMLGAALAAFAEDDLKRVLAWSTVSQLAYMAGGLAVGGWTASVWHLLTHAAFKALLFLAAGSVLRAVGSNLMSDMGGLWRRMPVTFGTALVGAGALVGLPPFAGAFSKDGILDAARQHGGALGDAVYVVGLVTAFVTAAYVTRLVARTFLGTYRGAAEVHESPRVMTWPLVGLAVAAIGLGAPLLSSSYGIRRWLDVTLYSRPLEVGVGGALLSAGIALAGVLVVALLFRRSPASDPVDALGKLGAPLRRAFWVDELYDVAFVRPTRRVASALLTVDRGGIDATAVGSGRLAVLAGGGLRRLQNGNAQAYLSALIGGVVVVVLSVSLAVAS